VEPTIPAQEFQRRLMAIDLVLHATQIQAIIRKYRVNVDNEVNWKAFVADVEQSKTIGE
jgi:hypothetical protein